MLTSLFHYTRVNIHMLSDLKSEDIKYIEC